MVLTMGRLVRCVAVLSAVLVLFSSGLWAQERGQYVPGFSGLNSGVQAPPGFTYANYFIWYPSILDRFLETLRRKEKYGGRAALASGNCWAGGKTPI